jgi:hypothetical protein
MIPLHTALTQGGHELFTPEQGTVRRGLEMAQAAGSEPVTFGLVGKVHDLPTPCIFHPLRRKQSPVPSRPGIDSAASHNVLWREIWSRAAS